MSSLEIPIRSQLSATIYHKSMRMKDIKFVGQLSSENTGTDNPREDSGPGSKTEVDDLASLLSEDNESDSIPLEKLKKESPSAKTPELSEVVNTSQGAINLLGVDASRIAEFAARQYVFLSIFVTSMIAIIFLVNLIGWISLCAGLLAPIILTPLNMMASKAYAAAQTGLMKDRDEKVTVVTEALQGIRQIKFSATESKWQERIMKVRDAELGKQKRVFVWTVVLRFFWISSPILLSLISLATYVWIHGSLSASVAFTALAVFGNLEFALSLIPFGITQGIDALVSCRRIERLIYDVEKGHHTTPGDSIEFKNAAIAWSATGDQERAQDRFVLRNINLKFPNGKLR
jgi:ABC-type multidrug transport system fused ATPase/permease subunit